MKLPESVLILVHTPALRVLLLERADHPGFWQSVTGSREPGDPTLRDTCRRELAEETGFAVSDGRLEDWALCNRYEIYPHWRHRYAPGVTHNTEHVFDFEIGHERPVSLSPAEHLQYCWLDWHDALERCFSWTNAAAIRMLAQRHHCLGR